jgi:hypothetical protein
MTVSNDEGTAKKQVCKIEFDKNERWKGLSCWAEGSFPA